MSIDISELYKRDLYLDKDLPFLFNTSIYEYDMHHAGISITKELQLLDEESIARIEAKSKNKRDTATLLGLMQRKNPKFKKELAEGFVEMRKRFFTENELEDRDILSIKKDAIFTFKKCPNKTFGEVSFNCKNVYSSYVYTGKYEFYYREDHLDVKGIDDSYLYDHQEGMMKFLKHLFYMIENDSHEKVLRYLKIFIDRYKRRELEVDYYRSFDLNNDYVTLDGSMRYTSIGKDLLPEINIDHNYFEIILPMLRTQL